MPRADLHPKWPRSGRSFAVSLIQSLEPALEQTVLPGEHILGTSYPFWSLDGPPGEASGEA
jgi:hypothetical protein